MGAKWKGASGHDVRTPRSEAAAFPSGFGYAVQDIAQCGTLGGASAYSPLTAFTEFLQAKRLMRRSWRKDDRNRGMQNAA